MRWAAAVAALALLAAGPALAQDPATEIAAAEATAADAQAQIAVAEQDVAAAQEELAPVAEQAAEASDKAETALDRLDALEQQMIDRRIDAAEEVAALETDYEDEVAIENKESEEAIGFGLACLALAAIAFWWSGFRQLSVVERLSAATTGVAAGAISGLILGSVILGAALMSSSGLARVIGAFVVLGGVGIGVAVWGARHSIRVEQGEGQPLFSRQRLPGWITLALAILLALIFVVGLGEGLLAGDPDEPAVTEHTRQLAEAAEDDPAEPPTSRLEQAQAAAEPLVEKAKALADPLQEAKAARQEAQDQLATAKARLNQSETTIVRAQRELSQQAAAAERAATRAANQAQREAEQAAREAAQAAPAPSANYSSCDTAPPNIPVPPGSALDADGDGIGCET